MSDDATTSTPTSQDDNSNTTTTTDQGGAQSTTDTGPILSADGNSTSDNATGDGAAGSSQDQGGGDQTPAPLEITVPEGAQFDAAILDGFKTTAQAQGLNSEQASAVVAWWADIQNQALQAQANYYEQTNKDWQSEIRNDKELGGANYGATVAAAKKGLVWAGGEQASELADQLQKAGVANWPPLVRLFAKIGKHIAEDNSGGGGGSGKMTEKERLNRRFPSSATT